MRRASRGLVITTLIGACAPNVSADEPGSTGESTDATSVNSTTGTSDATVSSVSTGSTTSSSSAATSTDSDTTTAAESEAGGYEEDSGTGCAFTCPNPPGGGGSLECDLWAQDCPDGEKCMPWANDGGPVWNATRCSPLDPMPGSLGDVCTVEGSGVSGIDSCERAHMCWNVDGNGVGVCAALCTGSSADPMCPGDFECMDITEVLPLCVDGCDPLAQDCGALLACAPSLGPLVCAPAGPAQTGEPCAVDGCAAGSVCIDGAFALDCVDLACCATYCDPNAAVCAPGATCQAFDDTPDLGVCIAA